MSDTMEEETRPIELQGGRLCGLPGMRCKVSMDETEFVDDDDGRIYLYEKHHQNSEGVDVFRIVSTRHPKAKKKS